jgi:drug/metabolite transporter (DMT)-like permease
MIAVLFSPRISEGENPARGALYGLAAGLIANLGNLGYYNAVALGAGAAIAVSLSALYPIVTIVFAFLCLGERPNRVQLLGIGAALAAIYFLNVGNSGESYAPWLLYALAPILFWGVAGVLTKVATDHAAAELGGFWFLMAYLPWAGLLMLNEPMTWSLPVSDWWLLGLLGFTYGLGNLTVLAAYRAEGEASIVTPLAGLYPVLTIPLAITLFDERIVTRQWLGIGLALVAFVGLVYEPRRPSVFSAAESSDVST